ncbi:hypothetical protein MiSe_33200 [Microseira wollei NIES-4236]|uniref:DUF3131 domain-containing protein n=2 Tax=Microseira wollei TaxID=467598 RepID=A0AAV3XGH2_9CYAN|nr:hypothetical protein MiSe_33200 [Microseira wollei NIES-4236]
MMAMTSAILPVFLVVTTNQQQLVCPGVQVWECSSTCCSREHVRNANLRRDPEGCGDKNEARFSGLKLLKPGSAGFVCVATRFRVSATNLTCSRCNTRQGINSLAYSESRLKTTAPKFPVHFNGLSLLARKFISGRAENMNENDARSQNQRRQLIALPDYYHRDWQPPSPSLPTTTPPPAIPFEEHAAPAEKPSLPPPIAIEKPVEQVSPPKSARPIAPPAAPPVANTPPRLTTDADRIAARRAWQYFERNWNAQTGFVNSVENYPWTTWWDQGSAILGMHAAHRLGLIKTEEFNSKINRLLQTLERLSLAATGLPNKAYSTNTAQMMRLDNTPDPRGTSGWSALDMARFLLGLRVLRSHYPQFQARCDQIVAKWNLSQLVKDGWLQGGIIDSNGRIRLVQEGRFGYEQYAAYSLKLWNIEALNALNNPPFQTIQIDGIELQIDRRNLSNSGASNYLTNDPYLLWGLELGWNDSIKPHVLNLFKVQAKRFETTGILTAVNEDSIDRPPYFLYYSVYANGQSWMPINIEGRTFPHLRFLSTKAAFAWAALMSNEPYAKKLRESVQNLAAPNRGYLAGRYENPRLGVNNAIDVNTNAVVLESLLYQARSGRSLVF